MGRIEICCQNCGVSGRRLSPCNLCHIVYYCSQSCKTADAECHGKVCFEDIPKPIPKVLQFCEVTNIFGSFFTIIDNEYFTEEVLREVMEYFTFYDVITDFRRIPHSNMEQIKLRKQVMLAQISKREEDSKNIFIKDIFGTPMYVIFNFKATSSSINWSELFPDTMICIRNPILHTFASNLVFCINKEDDIKVL